MHQKKINSEKYAASKLFMQLAIQKKHLDA